jgi:hypothetical protein
VISLLGKALAPAAACFDPDCIVVESYLFRDRPTLLHRLWQAADACFKSMGSQLVRLTPATIGQRGRLLSLVVYVGDRLAQTEKLTG